MNYYSDAFYPRLAQRVVPRLPLLLIQRLLAFINQPAVLRLVLALYVRAFWLEIPWVAARKATIAVNGFGERI